MKKLFLLPFLLCILAPALLAQEWTLALVSNVELRTWKLSTKADKEEKGLGGAVIKLFKGTALITQVTSSGNGDFKIDVPANGDFMLEVSYPGCNTKKFAISTENVPENIAKDNFRPSYGIGGFIMAKALPGIDYSYLSQPLVKVVYVSRGKFEDDNSVTERSLKAVSRISEAENALIEKFCAANREGDAALSKPDCPLAKSLYEKALSFIPGEPYPAQQLPKVGKCLKDKEESDKKAKEAAAATATAAGKQAADKKDADKKAIEDAVAKAKADKAAKDQDMNDKLAKAREQEAKKKAATEKKTPEPEKAKEVSSSPQPTATAVKTKNSVIIVKEKTEDELEAERRKAGKAKSEAEDAAAIKADAEKAEAKHKEKEKKYQENQAKEKEEEQKKAEEKRLKEKEHADKIAQEEKTKAEEAQKKRAEQEAKDKEDAQKEAADAAAKAKEDQEARDKEEAERAAKEKEERKKTYDKIEKKYDNGKSKSEYKIPAPLGSANVYKEKIQKADELFNAKRYAEAKKEYEEALKQKPNDEYANGKLAEIAKLQNP